MSTFGVDNFIGELSVDGSVANFKFTDPDDVKNVMEVSLSPKEFPEGTTQADSREVADYAYSLVAEKMNATRSDRLAAAEAKQASESLEREKSEKAAVNQHLKDATDNHTPATTTETREDGVKQQVYNTAAPSDAKKK
jgi:hypothetical protein